MEYWDYLKYKAELEDYDLMRRSIPNAEQRIETLKRRMPTIRSATTDSTPVSGGTNSREDALVNNISERSDLQKKSRYAKEDIAAIEAALSALNDRDRLILDRVYIHPYKGSKTRLCDELGLKDERSVRARQSEALRRYVIARCSK